MRVKRGPAAVRRPQLQVYLPDGLLDEAAAAVDAAVAADRPPATLSRLVEDALRAHLRTVAVRVNGGRPFDRAVGARVRESRRRGQVLS